MERHNRFALLGLIALALILGIIAFDPGMRSQIAFAQGPKPTPPKPKAPTAQLGTGFTYQGQLKNNGVLVNGNCYLQFNLWGSNPFYYLVAGPVNGSPNPVTVTNGLFTVQIDFGTGAFQGDARWLQTMVKCGSDSGFTTLSLQPVAPAPYALFSMMTAWGQSWAGTGVGLTARSSTWIGLAGVATQSPFLNPFPLGMFGVYGEGDDVGVWGQSSTTNGLGVEGSNPTSNNYGQLGTPSNGVHGVGVSTGGNGVYGESTTGDGVSGLANDPNKSGVYGRNLNGGYGVYGYCTGSGCFGVFSNGDMRVTGNLTVDGQANGFFPRPAYDSGWIAISVGTPYTLTHNIGGNPDNYVVDMQFKDNTNGQGINQMYYGGTYGPSYLGAWWRGLTAQQIGVYRESVAPYLDQVRIRIWVYK